VSFVVPFSLEGVSNINHFVKREAEAKQMDVLLNPDGTAERKLVVLYGMGGIGKTQLAADFARRHKERFSAIFWIDGSSQDSVRRGLVACVARLPSDSERSLTSHIDVTNHMNMDTDARIERFMAWLTQKENTKWLLIFDNVDREFSVTTNDPQAYDFGRYIPRSSHGNILVTTRVASLKKEGKSIIIGTVNKNQAREMLEYDDNGARHPVASMFKILLHKRCD